MLRFVLEQVLVPSSLLPFAVLPGGLGCLRACLTRALQTKVKHPPHAAFDPFS